MGFRGIARVTEINHTTIMNWVAEVGESLSDELPDSEIPQRTCPHVITEIDELQTFVGNKKNKLWIRICNTRKRESYSGVSEIAKLAEGIALMKLLNRFGKLLNAGIVFPKGYRSAFIPDLLEKINSVVNLFNPYLKIINNSAEIKPNQEEYRDFDWQGISKAWVNLGFALIRSENLAIKIKKKANLIDRSKLLINFPSEKYLLFIPLVKNLQLLVSIKLGWEFPK